MKLNDHVVDAEVRARNVEALRANGVQLPKFSELAEPESIPQPVERELQAVDPNAPHPLNLYRIHWFNAKHDRGFVHVPEHVVLPSSLTGVDAKIVVLFGNRFPMIGAHKVLAAYACLAPRVVTGEFDLTRDRAVWPSTGNFCRGGVAVSRIVGCRGVAVLPAGMSAERFRWLEKWADPNDVVRTPGTESNVKEIYDACAELSRDPANVIINQFAEYANYLVHNRVTGRAVGRVFDSMSRDDRSLKLRGFVSATGSAGTIAAGDYLKQTYGSLTVAVEAVECPTMLNNGFGDHNIQGIGDKHVPLIHNVMATDVVAAVSDRATDSLNVVFNSDAGRELLASRFGVPQPTIDALRSMGLSSIANVIAAIKFAKYYRLGASDVVATVATDGAEMYGSEIAKRFPRGFDAIDAATAYGRFVLGATTDDLLELSLRDRERIFNIGYFTWVEQQGVSLNDFMQRAKPEFWRGLHRYVSAWDAMIAEVNAEVAAAAAV